MNRDSLKLDRFVVGTILASLAALALAAPALAQQQWEMFRFDPLRMGCNRFETQIDPGSTETDDTGVSYMPFTLQFPRRHVAASIATQFVVDNESTAGDFAASPGSGAAWSVVTPQATWNQQGSNWLIAPAVDIAKEEGGSAAPAVAQWRLPAAMANGGTLLDGTVLCRVHVWLPSPPSSEVAPGLQNITPTSRARYILWLVPPNPGDPSDKGVSIALTPFSQSSGGAWVPLGDRPYYLTPGLSYVELRNTTDDYNNKYVVADAVRFTRATEYENGEIYSSPAVWVERGFETVLVPAGASDVVPTRLLDKGIYVGKVFPIQKPTLQGQTEQGSVDVGHVECVTGWFLDTLHVERNAAGEVNPGPGYVPAHQMHRWIYPYGVNRWADAYATADMFVFRKQLDSNPLLANMGPIWGGVYSSPLISDQGILTDDKDAKWVFIGGADGQVYALGAETGELKWSGPGITLDEYHADIEGSDWTLVDKAPYYIPRGDAFFGAGYLSARAKSGGNASVVWETPDRFRSDQPGYYKIYVFIPPRMLDGSGNLVRRAARATYTVEYDDPDSSKDPDEFVVTIDQNTEGWVALPAPRMGLGHTAFWNPKTVKLTNASSSPGDFDPKTGLGYEIVADAVRIVPEMLGSFTYSSPVICRLPAIGEEKYGVFIGDTGGRLWKLDVRPVMSGARNTGWTRFSCWPRVRTEWSGDAEDEDDPPVSPIVCSPAVWDPGGGGVRRIVFGTTDPSGKSGRFYSVLADFSDPKPVMFPAVDDPNPQAVTSTPTIPDQGPLKGKAIFATLEGKIYAFKPDSGDCQQIYPTDAKDAIVGAFNYSSPAVRSNTDGTDGRRLYAGSTDGKLYAFDVDSFGRLKKAWTKQDPATNTRIDAPANLLAPIQSSVAATANGQPGNPRPWLFTGTMDGKMWWVKDKGDQSDFVKQRAFWETEGSAVFSSPAVLGIGTNQWLFVGSNDGLVYGWSNAALPAGWAELGVEAYGSEGEAPTATDIGETQRMPMANAWVDRDPADPEKKYYEDCGDWIEFDECPGYKVLESDSPGCAYTKGLPPDEYGGVDWKTLKDKTPWLIPHKYSEAKLGNKLVGNVVRLEWGETLRLIAWNLSKDARDSRFTLTSTGEGQQAGSSYSYSANVTGQYNPYCPKNRPKEGDADWEDWMKDFPRLKNTCPTAWEKDPEKRWKHDLHSGKVFWRTCANPQDCEPPGVKPDCYPDPDRPRATLKWDDFTKSFAKYAYVLDASSSAKPQTPGMSYTISFSYRGTKDVTEVSVDPNDPLKTKTTTKKMTYTAVTVVPQPDSITSHPGDPSLWQPQSFAINNPLGINAGSGYALGWDTSRGFNRGRSNTQNHMNGNGGKQIPLPLGDANHGLDSPQSSVGIMDRSYVGALLNLQIDKFRVRPSDLRWLGGPAAAEAANPLPTDILPPIDQTVANISPDYPDIPATKITFVKESDNANPAYFPTNLAPCNPPDDYRPIPDPIRTWVTVPKYQPPNVSGTRGGLLTTIKGYGTDVYAYVDSNNNARPDVGLSILGRPITYSEAYREFTEGVTVLPDYKMKAQEETLDIGAVPHGFGMYNGFGPYNAAYAKWFRDITVHNTGNCNLKNLTVGRMPLYSQNVGIYDPDGDGYPDDVNGTYPLSGQGVSTSLHVGGPYNLKKPYPDGDPVLLEVKSPVDGKWYRPRISIAVPVSQPVGTYASRILVFADENKNDKWDWQISEYGASGGKPEAAADPSSTLLVRVRESRLTDGLTEGVLPQVDMPDKPLSGDISPAAFRAINPVDGTGLDLHLFWSSNRFQSAEPFPDDPWFIYYTRLPFVPNPMAPDPRLQWQPASANPPQWWSPVLPNNHIPPLDYQDEWKDGWPVMRDPKTDGLPGELIPRSVRHINPSVTQDPLTGQTWLFWQGQATKATADNNYFRENRVFYTDVTGGNVQNKVFSFTQDYTMVKYGPRGLAYREDPNDDPVKPASGAWLWVFWYGGDAGRFSIFYNVNRWNAGAQHDPMAWTQDVKVLTPSSLASVSEPIPILRRIWNHEDRNKPRLETYIDLVYAGISKHGQNTDVYMTRYKPTVDSRGRVTLPYRKFPRIGTRDARDLPVWERLQRDPGSSVYYSRHISWSPPGKSMTDVDRPIVTVVLPGDNTVYPVIDNNISKAYDQATGTYVYSYPDNDPMERAKKFGQVLLDMSAGTVRFAKPISPKALVRARYTPRALRLNTSGVLKLDKLDFPEAAVGNDLSWRWTANHASDGAPFAMLEKSPILNKADLWNAPPCGQNLTQPVPVDRFWVFWRRPQAEVRATTIYYKTMRLGVQLALPIAAEVGPTATGHWAKPIKITEILPDGSERAFTGPFEAVLGDVGRAQGGRIYFTESDEYRTILGNVRDPQSDALRVRVEYTGVNPLNPSKTIPAEEVSYVTWLDELPEQALLGDQTLDMVNEGQLCAVPDPPARTCNRPSWMPTSVWLFWTSTRSGSSDLYYETISPNFRPALWRQ